jgi:hypothetical protein
MLEMVRNVRQRRRYTISHSSAAASRFVSKRVATAGATRPVKFGAGSFESALQGKRDERSTSSSNSKSQSFSVGPPSSLLLPDNPPFSPILRAEPQLRRSNGLNRGRDAGLVLEVFRRVSEVCRLFTVRHGVSGSRFGAWDRKEGWIFHFFGGSRWTHPMSA